MDRVISELSAHRAMGCQSVGFLGGEPTAHPHIIDCVRHARELGFRRVSLCSNGTRLCDADFAKELVRAGASRFTISVHSHRADIEDRLTGVPGNFERKVRGIRNLVGLMRRGGIRDNVSLNPVLNGKNYLELPGYVEFFRAFGIRDFRFNYVWPRARAAKDRGLIPTYTEAVPRILDLILRNETKFRVRLGFSGVPLCVLPWGEMKERVMENLSRKYFSDSADLDTVVSFGNTHFELKEQRRRMFKRLLRSCRECRFSRSCEGVWKSYLALYGPREIVPCRF